jgi:predicted nuclease of restriction endonuclease-like (RecB) superfamily
MHYDQLLSDIGNVNNVSQALAARSVNQILTLRNWLIGAYIIEFEQSGLDRATYRDRLLERLAEDLSTRGISGFSQTNLRNFRLFARVYAILADPPLLNKLLEGIGFVGTLTIRQPVADELKMTLDMPTLRALAQSQPALDWQDSAYYQKLFSSLSWSHLVQLTQISLPLKRAFYEVECMKSRWSRRELKRQMDSALFDRVGLSKDKDGVMDLAQKGQILISPTAMLRDPYIFEFLGLEERNRFSEAALEKALIDHLQQFMRELGRDFCFVDRQYRIAVGSEVYHLDLLFYHRKLRCLVAIDLKLGPFKHEYAGQMNFYLNYLRHEQTYEDENPPIGLLLCTEKDETVVQYATGGMDNQLFVSRYQSVLPSIEQLQQWLQREKEYLLQLAEAKEEE